MSFAIPKILPDALISNGEQVFMSICSTGKSCYVSNILNPISIGPFGVLWYFEMEGTMCPQISKPLLNLKFLSKSNQIKAER